MLEGFLATPGRGVGIYDREGVTKGSVEEGGVYRELTRPVADPVREK